MVERTPIGDPRSFHSPVREPTLIEPALLLPFKPSTRDYWMKVGNWSCQYEYYDGEKRGWLTCRKRAKHVHHIIPEGWELQHGNDPEHGTGLPLCDGHHVRNSGETLGEKDSSFHPDVSENYRDYGAWKEQEKHMRSIGEKRRSVDYSDSPFAQTAHEHHNMAVRGERYWGGDERSDQYYIEKMQNMAVHSGIKKPETAPHPRVDPSKKTHWSDEVVGDKGVTTETFRPGWFRRRG